MEIDKKIRKECENNSNIKLFEFEFPQKEELTLKLKDILEEEVDEKYYLTEKQIESLRQRNEKFNMKGNRFINEDKEFFSSLVTNIGQNDSLLTNRKINTSRFGDNIFSGVPETSPTLVAIGETDVSRIVVPKKEIRIIKISSGDHQQDIIYDSEGLMGTIPAGTHGSTPHLTKTLLSNNQVRRLTPKECFRLQGFLNDEVNLEGISDNQRYRLAGNGQTVTVVKKIFEKMFI